MGFAVYYLALALVVALAASKGGRFERQMALVMVAASLSSILAQLMCDTLVPIVPFTCIDALVLFIFIRVFSRYRRLWVLVALAVQFFSLAFDIAYASNFGITQLSYLNMLNLFFYGVNLSIACGVVLRRIGPPVPLPQRGNPRNLPAARTGTFIPY